MLRGQAPTTHRLPLLYATDGSAITKGGLAYLGYGYVATDGSYGCGGSAHLLVEVGRDPAVVAELRAIWHVIRPRIKAGTATVVLVDSTNAMALLDAWADGKRTMPPAYTGTGLREMRAQVHQHHPLIAWVPVKGHAGHLLNEAADSLAQIGRRQARGEYSKADARIRAARLVEGFMADERLLEVA